MTNEERIASLIALSESKYKLQVTADWRYQHFFYFLQVSPSYRLVHLIAQKKIDPKTTPLPRDFRTVVQTYRAFGSVYRTFFWEWWLKKAQFQFGVSAEPQPVALLSLGFREDADEDELEKVKNRLFEHLNVDRRAQGHLATLVAAIPITGDKRRDVAAFEALWAQHYGVSESPKTAPYSVLRNKVREHTLDSARRVLLAKAAIPKKRLFIVGNRSDIAPAYFTDENAARILDRRKRGARTFPKPCSTSGRSKSPRI